ncbi:uncharacterized protein LOC124348516 [Daphnia pulicaria]|uniref:uncharacterized protein LOC124348516 n=1 Tax=Daphnia pulicaria TaxID=35523 RepID=UPI001EEA4231|nr:uncharacterized protein LOC124348516 [Daphnia pulicaria]
MCRDKEIYLNMWSNAVSCCEFHFFGFVIMNLSVCFLEKHAVSLWNRVVLARRFLSQRWLLSMTNVLLHPYLPDVRSSSFCFIASYQKYNLSYYFTDELEHFSGRPGRFRAAITHLQSLTTGLCPGNAEETSRRWARKHLRYLQNFPLVDAVNCQ